MHAEYNLLLPKLSQYEAKHKTKFGGANCFQRIKLVTAAKHSVYHQKTLPWKPTDGTFLSAAS